MRCDAERMTGLGGPPLILILSSSQRRIDFLGLLLMNKKFSQHDLAIDLEAVPDAEPTPNPSLEGRGV